MMRTLVAAFAASALLAGIASAQTSTTPVSPATASEPSATSAPVTAGVVATNPEECLKSAFDLAQKAESQGLSMDQLERIEDMLGKMEGHCDEKQFSEAAMVAKDLAGMIEAKPQ